MKLKQLMIIKDRFGRYQFYSVTIAYRDCCGLTKWIYKGGQISE